MFSVIGGRSRKWFTLREAIEILHEREKHSKVEYFTLAGCTLINEPMNHLQLEPISHHPEMSDDELTSHHEETNDDTKQFTLFN